MIKFAVVLSGSGVYDGTEIHEAVLSLYAIQKEGAEYSIFAPDIAQHHVINHITGEEMPESRNVLVESARIARGKISPLNEFNADNYDVLLFPGGFGAAKNLSSFAFDGINCQVNEDVENSIKAMLERNKPIGALCISPVILAKVIGDGIDLTIGSDKATIHAIKSMGATHKVSDHGEIVYDRKYKVVSTACYMLDATIDQIGLGAENVVKKLIELV